MQRGRAEARLCPCPLAGGSVIRVALVLVVAAVVLLVAATAARAQLRPDVVAYWQRIHACEQPSGWHGGFPNYPGGLGIYRTTWTWWASELGLLQRYPNGATAPPLIQIAVADYGWRHHHGNWGCMRTVGYPPA